jgi:CLIP-associating protein 1/2
MIDGEPATVKAKTAVPSKRAQRRPSGGEPHDPTQEHPDPSGPSRIPPECEKLEPIIIASPREIDEMVNTMLLHFEGRESDDNWLAREKDVYALRRLTRGNAPHDFLPQYMAAIKSLLDGVFKVVTSLRTTVSSVGCLFIQDLAKTCRGQIDPMVEIMMQNLLKICGGMKKITAQAGSTTVDVVIDNVSYSSRILQHVSGACHDKNTQLRLHSAGWLKTLINKQAGHKSSLEHNGGLDVLEKSIKKGLADANPGVREKMRITFWVFFDVFPEKANEYVDPCLDSGD